MILVNADNRCQVEKLEREGIFLDLGDLLFFTGNANVEAGQMWSIWTCDCSFPDPNILYLIKAANLELADCAYSEGVAVFEGVGVGQTRVDLVLEWGCNNYIRHLSFDVYVGIRPSLSAYPTRGSCYWCDSSDFWKNSDVI